MVPRGTLFMHVVPALLLRCACVFLRVLVLVLVLVQGATSAVSTAVPSGRNN